MHQSHEERTAPRGASRRAAVVAAAYTTLATLFPTRQAALQTIYEASLAALRRTMVSDGGSLAETRALPGEWRWRWGTGLALDRWVQVAYPPFTGGTAVGQWRPTPPAFGPMSAQGLAFTFMFVLPSIAQFSPGPPRGLTSATYGEDSMP